MQRITLFAIISVSALLVGIVLGANIFAENVSFRHSKASESPDIAGAHEWSDFKLRLDDLITRIEGSESQLRSHQQLLERFSDELVLLKRSNVSVNDKGQQAQAAQEEESVPQVINVNAFLEAGFSADRAIELDERYADLALRRLYLRDQALREGWLSEPRFGEERTKLNNEEEAIASELGEATYDRYLYATGQPNRVSVTSVIRQSPAEASGIEDGDVIYRYAGSRVYDSFDLRNATSDGEFGVLVAVEILRGDSLVEFYIPRGPLGVQLQSDSVKP